MACFSDRFVSANKLIIAAAALYAGAVTFAHAADIQGVDGQPHNVEIGSHVDMNGASGIVSEINDKQITVEDASGRKWAFPTAGSEFRFNRPPPPSTAVAPVAAHATDWWVMNDRREPGTLLCERSTGDPSSPADTFKVAQMMGWHPHLTDNGDEVILKTDAEAIFFYRNESACWAATKRKTDAATAAAAQGKQLDAYR
jgi:hypothetical protein